MHIVWATFLCALLALHGLRKQSLSVSGAMAAVIVGMATFTHASLVFTAILLTFYLSSSKLTKMGSEQKARLEEGATVGGKRTAIQVFANGFTGSVISLIHSFYVASSSVYISSAFGKWGQERSLVERLNTALFCAYIAELGILSKQLPVLITSFKAVPPGTNGGVSKLGLLASIGGGAFVGVMPSLCLFLEPSWTVSSGLICILIGAISGLCGSLGIKLDSLLGATIQRTTYNKKSKQVTTDYRVASATEDPSDLVVISGYGILDNHQAAQSPQCSDDVKDKHDTLSRDNGATLAMGILFEDFSWFINIGDTSIMAIDPDSGIPLRIWRRVGRSEHPEICSFEDSLGFFPFIVKEGQSRLTVSEDYKTITDLAKLNGGGLKGGKDVMRAASIARVFQGVGNGFEDNATVDEIQQPSIGEIIETLVSKRSNDVYDSSVVEHFTRLCSRELDELELSLSPDIEIVAQALCDTALIKGSADDITVVIVELQAASTHNLRGEEGNSWKRIMERDVERGCWKWATIPPVANVPDELDLSAIATTFTSKPNVSELLKLGARRYMKRMRGKASSSIETDCLPQSNTDMNGTELDIPPVAPARSAEHLGSSITAFPACEEGWQNSTPGAGFEFGRDLQNATPSAGFGFGRS
ncbi:Transmembrane protein 19 [Dinochytrium kinnereticum]|nr:Transmembrane protein 19 [Dinochytrium kinnereticum]